MMISNSISCSINNYIEATRYKLCNNELTVTDATSQLQNTDAFVYTVNAKTACGIFRRKGTVMLLK